MEASRIILSSLLFLLLSLYHSSLSAASVSRFPAGLAGHKPLKKPPPGKVAYEIRHFTQNLDHFDYQPQSYATLQQRYLFDDRHWGGAKNGSPIFVYTGNEGDIEWFAENTGFMFDVAPYFKALLVFIEVIKKNKFLHHISLFRYFLITSQLHDYYQYLHISCSACLDSLVS